MLRCMVFLIEAGICFFLLGRLAPKKWFRADAFPFQAFRFEREGKLYDKLHIRAWQHRVPDMSRILPSMMPAKKLSGDLDERLPRMIQETCVAEMTHVLLCVVGFRCIKLWRGAGGVILSILNALGNLVFVVIQRYNRPRLVRLQTRIARKHILKESLCEL